MSGSYSIYDLIGKSGSDLACARSREEVARLVGASGGCGADFIMFLTDEELRVVDAWKLLREGDGIQRFPVSLAIRLALRAGAAGMIIVQERNDPVPRRPDIELTQRLNQALSETGTKLLDHLLIAGKTVSPCRTR